MCHPTNGTDREGCKFPRDLRKVIGTLFPAAACLRRGNQPSAAAGLRLASSRQSWSFSDALISRGSSTVWTIPVPPPACAQPAGRTGAPLPACAAACAQRLGPGATSLMPPTPRFCGPKRHKQATLTARGCLSRGSGGTGCSDVDECADSAPTSGRNGRAGRIGVRSPFRLRTQL
jgi:hypothetical protein